MSSTSVFSSLSGNLFRVIECSTSATHDYMLLIRASSCSRSTESYSWLSSANSLWETGCLSMIRERDCVYSRNRMGQRIEP